MTKLVDKFERRKARVRYSLRVKARGRVRLSVFRSGKHIYAQLIDDAKGVTVVSASSLDKGLGLKTGSTIEAAHKVGALVAQRAKDANVSSIVFDRGGYIFHGRVKALAEAAREAGLAF
jgi:large subunit ribosomal protein L18